MGSPIAKDKQHVATIMPRDLVKVIDQIKTDKRWSRSETVYYVVEKALEIGEVRKYFGLEPKQ